MKNYDHHQLPRVLFYFSSEIFNCLKSNGIKVALNTGFSKIITDTILKKIGWLNADFIDCLNDEPKAISFFNSLAKGHQNYFSKLIDSAKTVETKSKRIAMAVNALAKKMGYPEMIREQVADNKLLVK